jgi:hypothetical protein
MDSDSFRSSVRRLTQIVLGLLGAGASSAVIVLSFASGSAPGLTPRSFGPAWGVVAHPVQFWSVIVVMAVCAIAMFRFAWKAYRE